MMKWKAQKERRTGEQAKFLERLPEKEWRSSALYLALLSTLLLFATLYLPDKLNHYQNIPNTESPKALSYRKTLLEALDRYVQRQHHYRETFGRYTHNLNNLILPDKLSTGSLSDINQVYEIAVLKASNNHLLIMARSESHVGDLFGVQKDHITIDGDYVLSANFPIPPLSKRYLLSDVDRTLRLHALEIKQKRGLSQSYWRIEEHSVKGYAKWSAIGLRNPVKGEHRVFTVSQEEESESIFSQVHQQIKTTLKIKRNTMKATKKTTLSKGEIFSFLTKVYFAQRIFYTIHGYYTQHWKDLELVAGFPFQEKIKNATNIKLEPIQRNDAGYRVGLRGTFGELLGERFHVNENGSLEQTRYTDVLVKELERSTRLLGSSLQVTEILQENPIERSPSSSQKSTYEDQYDP